MTTIKPIHLALKGAHTLGSTDPDAPGSLPLAARFMALTDELLDGLQQSSSVGMRSHCAAVADFLHATEVMDADYGADASLPVADAADAADEALTSMAEIAAALDREAPEFAQPMQARLDSILLGIALWCMRHELPMRALAPVVNGLARKANAATTRQDVAAAFALMQGVVEHVSGGFSADLDRSDPQRPWRILLVNLGITAIRTGDADMIRYAFSRVEANLPDEYRHFLQEMASTAVRANLPADVQRIIDEALQRAESIH